MFHRKPALPCRGRRRNSSAGYVICYAMLCCVAGSPVEPRVPLVIKSLLWPMYLNNYLLSRIGNYKSVRMLCIGNPSEGRGESKVLSD
ncbi:hypothetical protein K445DRAFT_97166 [Daldinia sp. EC12]|nr:hypothetical protein K445DRAFT_97166 [Daldinia sp. EC12]